MSPAEDAVCNLQHTTGRKTEMWPSLTADCSDGADGSISSLRLQLLYKQLVLISHSVLEIVRHKCKVLGTVRLYSKHMPEKLKKENSD
jgi:hypothetical protein